MENTPMIRAAGPDDLGAVADLLTDAFLPDPIMSVIVAAAPDPRAALDHLHRIELASHYLSEDEAVRASARVDVALDGSDRLLGVTLWDAPGTHGEVHDAAGPLGLDGRLPPRLDLGLLGGAWDLCLLNNRTCEAHHPTTSRRDRSHSAARSVETRAEIGRTPARVRGGLVVWGVVCLVDIAVCWCCTWEGGASAGRGLVFVGITGVSGDHRVWWSVSHVR